MKTILPRIRQGIETRPMLAVLLFCLLSLPLAAGLAGAWASAWKTGNLRKAIEAAHDALVVSTERVAEKTAYRFGTLHDLTDLLAGDAVLADALRDPATQPAAHRRLVSIARTLSLHRVLLLNRHGVCVVSNEQNPTGNLVGVDLADRDYVIRALRGDNAVEFVVGRVSSVPGFHFSAPVRVHGRIVGALVLKTDLQSLAGQLPLSSVVITDAAGVVVLSDDPARLLMAVPGAPALALDRTACLQLYKRDTLSMLPIRRVEVAGRPAYAVGREASPSLRVVAHMPQERLTVYGFQSLAGILDQAERLFLLHWATAFSLIYLSGCLLFATTIYVIRDRRQRRELRALNLELAEQARRDPLTGCCNRRPFDDMLERESLRSARTGAPFALAYVDLDRFKEVNDAYGHAVGDAVLVHVAGVMRAALRGVDDIARLGGDEFALLLPGADEDAAEEALRRVATRLDASPARTGAGDLWQTVSVGAAVSRGEMTPTELMLAADEALYASKNAGRNQVVVRRGGPPAGAAHRQDGN